MAQVLCRLRREAGQKVNIMKTSNLLIKAVGVGCLLFTSSSGFAQGSLTPPGAPGPTMKTLAQIEPRIPISTQFYQINASGSYYLTTNIVVSSGLDGVDINVSEVTLDLNGFTISTSDGGGGVGIYSDTLTDITICNGHINGGTNGFYYGIVVYGADEPSPGNVRVSGVSVSGCLYFGIDVGMFNSSLVESCAVQQVGGPGITAVTVTRSAVYGCEQDGIDAITVSDCIGNCTGDGDGISTQMAFNSRGSSGTNTSNYGIYATTANNCFGYSANGVGIAGVLAIGCYGQSVAGHGFAVTTANSCYSSTGDTGIANKYNMP